MAPNLAQLTTRVAELLEYPQPSAQVIMRAGREHKPHPILSTGGRGRSVVKATAKDAANLLIGLIASPSPVRAVEAMLDFGDLLLSTEEVHRIGQYGPDHPEMAVVYATAKELALAGTFRDCIAHVLEALGDPLFAKVVAPKLADGAKSGIRVPTIEVSIFDTLLIGGVRIDAARYTFRHAAIVAIKDPLDLEEVEARYAEESKTSGKYSRRIFSTKVVGNDVLLPIAEALSGRNFEQMLKDAADGL